MSHMHSTDKSLKGAGNNPLEVIGVSEVTISTNSKSVQEKLYVVKNLVTPLLGKPAISKLGLLNSIDEIQVDTDWRSEFPRLFRGLGTMESEARIILDGEVVPYAQSVPRRVAAARRQPLLDELQRMESLGVIEKVEEPTDWCAPCIVVPKKDGKLRLCIDFTRLNKAVKREFHPLPNAQETLSELGNSKIFSKLDANCGYWQMKLHPEAQKLTSFITPFGRYVCKRLPFGICSAPEIFQREMQKILRGVDGIVCQMDDILVHGSDLKQHDRRLREVLSKLQQAGVTLNETKCEFNKKSVKFLGHIIDETGIQADPDKTRAIVNFPTPTNKTELRRFFGIINYLGKFSPRLATETNHLRQLLGKDSDWVWGFEQARQFAGLKKILASTPVLTPFSVAAETMVSADASAYGIGAAVLQRSDGEWKPVAYASRALTTAEKRYAQIEKEALAICWACDKFHYYIAGKEITIETDHRPLLAILGEKELAKLPIRVQRFRLRMMNYTYKITYTPGSKLVLADALSRCPVVGEHVDGELTDSGESNEPLLVLELLDSLHISHKRLDRIKASMLEDEAGMLLLKYTICGWPPNKELPGVMKSFYAFRDYITSVEGVVFYMNRVFIPELERGKVLEEIHKGHQGELKCIRRAAEVVWWPGMTREIREVVKECPECEEFRRQPREPLKSTPLPEKPWWRIAIDLFEKDGRTYLVVVDYYSRYISVHELKDSTDSRAITQELEHLFCMLGIPNTIVSDNGPQFIADNFKRFADKWDINHVTSSPKFPQSNGEAERAVQTVKGLMNKNVHLHAALCAYRDTPLANGYSPSQLLFNRPMNSMGILTDNQVDVARLKEFEGTQRYKQAANYNARFATRERSPIRPGQRVVVRESRKTPAPATVVAAQGREVVVVNNQDNLIRRNRSMVTRARAQAGSPTEIRDLDGAEQPAEVIPATESLESSTTNSSPYSTGVPNDRAPSRSYVSCQPRTNQSPVASTTGHARSSQPRNNQSPSATVRTRYGRISKPVRRLNL